MGVAMVRTTHKGVEMNIEAEWKKGPDFAEVAEVLGVPTNCIMAAQPGPKKTTVLYTAEPDEHGFDPDEPILCAYLARDRDGILRTLDVPIMLGLTWADMQAQIEHGLEELFGDA
jgi:hypothetical protein